MGGIAMIESAQATGTTKERAMAATRAVGAEQIDSDDPFRYGWRYVRQVDEQGQETYEQVPLTLEDVLHPEEDDFIVQSESHIRRCRYLAEVLILALASDPTAVVVQDMRIDWGVPGVRAHGPDLAVLLGVRERKDWRTFHVREEQARPAMVIEVTSLSTVRHDPVTKLRHYARVGIPLYVLADRRALPPGRPRRARVPLAGARAAVAGRGERRDRLLRRGRPAPGRLPDAGDRIGRRAGGPSGRAGHAGGRAGRAADGRGARARGHFLSRAPGTSGLRPYTAASRPNRYRRAR
jgi:Uma2 family endonuclease